MSLSVSIVMPAFNEAKVIASSLEKILDYCKREIAEWEVVVVDDGSTDDTAAIVQTFDDVRFMPNIVNRGKGYSVKRGILSSNGDVCLFADVDLATPIKETKGLLTAVEGGADVSIASRQINSSKVVVRTPLRRLMASLFRLAVKVIAVRGVYDTQCGFKMFRRDAARDIFCRQRLDGWAFDVELLFIAQRLGYNIVEVPVAWRESTESSLSFLSPFQMLFDLLRIRSNSLCGHYRRPASQHATKQDPGYGEN